MLVRTRVFIRVPPRRRNEGWARRWPVTLFWACFRLTLRYVARRGWRYTALRRWGSTWEVVWKDPRDKGDL